MFNPYRENLFWGYLSISLRGIFCTPSTIIVEVLTLSPVLFYLFKVFHLNFFCIILIFLVNLISHNLWLKLLRFRTRYPYKLASELFDNSTMICCSIMLKFDIEKFDGKISFSIWRVQMLAILTQNGLKKSSGR